MFTNRFKCLLVFYILIMNGERPISNFREISVTTLFAFEHFFFREFRFSWFECGLII